MCVIDHVGNRSEVELIEAQVENRVPWQFLALPVPRRNHRDRAAEFPYGPPHGRPQGDPSRVQLSLQFRSRPPKQSRAGTRSRSANRKRAGSRSVGTANPEPRLVILAERPHAFRVPAIFHDPMLSPRNRLLPGAFLGVPDDDWAWSSGAPNSRYRRGRNVVAGMNYRFRRLGDPIGALALYCIRLSPRIISRMRSAPPA